MTPIADMVERMLTIGAPTEAILLAIRTIETSRDAERDASRFVTIPTRSKAALRAERYRSKRKQNQAIAKANDVAIVDSVGVTDERDASRDGVTPHCNLLTSLSIKEGTFEEKKEPNSECLAPAKRGTRLTEDWQPTPAGRQFAGDHGLFGARLDQAIAEFIDYWIAVPGLRGTKLKWDATWRNRVREITGKSGKSSGKRNVIDAADDLIERVNAFDKPIPRELRDGTGAADVRLLSKG